MRAADSRMAHFRRIVERLAREEGSVAQPHYRGAYRIVAEATGLKEEYVYQLFRGVKKRVGDDAAAKIERAFGEGKPPGWMDQAPMEGAASERTAPAAFEPLARPGVQEAVETISELLLALNEDGRAMASTALSNLARNPDRAAKAAETLLMLMNIHPRDPDPSRPVEHVGASSPAEAARPAARLTVKAGGGQKMQLSLPLHRALNPERDPFDERNAPANEQEWYSRVRAAPKAKK